MPQHVASDPLVGQQLWHGAARILPRPLLPESDGKAALILRSSNKHSGCCAGPAAVCASL